MNAAVRTGASERSLVTESMDVNEAVEGVAVAAAIESRLQPFEPKDAMDDRSVWFALPGQSDRFAAAKDCADHVTSTNLLCHAMEAKRCLLGILHLADAIGGTGDDVTFAELVLWQRPGKVHFENRHPLDGDAHTEEKTGWSGRSSSHGPGGGRRKLCLGLRCDGRIIHAPILSWKDSGCPL